MANNDDNISTLKAPRPSSYDIYIWLCICPENDDETVWYSFDDERERDSLLFIFLEARKENFAYKVFDKPHYYRDGAWHEGWVLEAEGPDKARERFDAMSGAELSQYIYRHLPRQAQIKVDEIIQEEGVFAIPREEWIEFRKNRTPTGENIVHFPKEHE